MRFDRLPLTVILILAGITFAGNSANAQITISSQDFFPRSEGEFRSTNYTVSFQSYPAVQSILNQTGPNQTFDFTPLMFDTGALTGATVQSTANGTPGEGHPILGSANYVVVPIDTVASNQAWGYWQLDDSSMRMLGAAVLADSDANGVTDTTFTEYNPPQIVYSFPIQFGDSWSQSYTVTNRGAFGMTETQMEQRVVVDSWGQLITPAGSDDALRVVQARTTIVNSDSTTFIQTSYFSTRTLSAFVLSDDNGTIFGASYGVTEEGPTALEDETPSRGFELRANYPNPFDRETCLPFTTDRPSYVELTLFDMLGRRVGTLADGWLPAGHHTSHLDATGLSNGIYVARLKVDGITQARQIVLSR